MNKYVLVLISVLTFLSNALKAQESEIVEVFKNHPVNFHGEKGDTLSIKRVQDGRLLFKKVKAPVFPEGTDVKLKMTLKSAGDAWDKSGSLFVVTEPDKIDIDDIANGTETFPADAGVKDYPGIKMTKNYIPALEILRFMTPFGVGYYSDEEAHPRIRYNRPVSVPNWAQEVVWEENISHLASELTGEFIIGVWIDTWTAEGYTIDVSLEYSGRPLLTNKVIPLVNTIYYAGQKHPDLFASQDLETKFELPEDATNVKLHYITTGHGGHSGGDEFIKINNKVSVDGRKVIDFIPWRDDCASFRRFNPSSGVWTRQDTAYAYNKKGEKEYKEIEERLASSDLSRSNWCPGSKVSPEVVNLGNMKKGNHTLKISIDGTPIEGEKLNHWLVSAYLTYEE